MKMKKVISLILAICLLASVCVIPSVAAEETAVQTVRALGIMVGDQQGNLHLEKNVTRAEFTKMLVAASSQRDSVRLEGTGYNVFSDVTGAHWASDYIRIAASQGWMLGYTDGSFRPQNNIKLEEACTAALRLIGYDATTLSGAFPTAQLTKAQELGLRGQITLGRGEIMTRLDCARLFYNLLTAQTYGGKTYAATLGFSVTGGTVDIASAVQSMLTGPFVARADTQLPFTPVSVYRDGVSTSNVKLEENDVYYYSTRISALWICTDRVSGALAVLSPNAASPTSVTVSGSTYALSGTAAYRLSSLASDMIGKTVTLLLGMNGEVVDVLTGKQVDSTYYGIVQSCSKSVTDEGGANVETKVSVICTDGEKRAFSVTRDANYEGGRLVVIHVTGNGTDIHLLNEATLDGYVSADAGTFADRKFAEGVEILDTEKDGAAVRIPADRLAGLRLQENNVKFYTLNDHGQIDRLILRSVTGDTWSFGFMTDRTVSQGTKGSATYNVLFRGKASTLRPSGNVSGFSAGIGGCAVCYAADGSVSNIRQLASEELSSLATTTATVRNRTLEVSENVEVYLRQDGNYYLTELDAVNVENYRLTAWYDNFGCVAGNKIRVIIAVRK